MGSGREAGGTLIRLPTSMVWTRRPLRPNRQRAIRSEGGCTGAGWWGDRTAPKRGLGRKLVLVIATPSTTLRPRAAQACMNSVRRAAMISNTAQSSGKRAGSIGRASVPRSPSEVALTSRPASSNVSSRLISMFAKWLRSLDASASIGPGVSFRIRKRLAPAAASAWQIARPAPPAPITTQRRSGSKTPFSRAAFKKPPPS